MQTIMTYSLQYPLALDAEQILFTTKPSRVSRRMRETRYRKPIKKRV